MYWSAAAEERYIRLQSDGGSSVTRNRWHFDGFGCSNAFKPGSSCTVVVEHGYWLKPTFDGDNAGIFCSAGGYLVSSPQRSGACRATGRRTTSPLLPTTRGTGNASRSRFAGRRSTNHKPRRIAPTGCARPARCARNRTKLYRAGGTATRNADITCAIRGRHAVLGSSSFQR